MCVCVCVPLDVALLPGQLCVALVELVHDEGHLRRGHASWQHVIGPRHQRLQHVGQSLQEEWGDTIA